MILADREIKAAGIVHPFYQATRCVGQRKVISYGVSSYGYDMRVGHNFKIFTPTLCVSVDPKKLDKRSFTEIVVKPGDSVLIPPNSFALAYSMEHFSIPRGVLGLVLGKSTYARCGIIVCCTPMEPEWKGHLTVEISNTTPLPAKVYAGEGIAQAIFLTGDRLCDVSYADKKGKYQDQKAEVTLPRL